MQQTYSRLDGVIERTVDLNASSHTTTILDRADLGISAEAAWWQSFLRGAPREIKYQPGSIRVVDAFCGSGGLALGLRLAAEALGLRTQYAAAIDTDPKALAVHRHNFGPSVGVEQSATSLVDFHVLGVGADAAFGYEPELIHRDLSGLGPIDFFIAGPPCQGHSNLNNHTRRRDARNELYVTAVAMGVALKSEAILLENVPTVQNAQSEVVATAISLLRASGYGVSLAVLKADELGAAQRRARHFLVAIRGSALDSRYLGSNAARLRADAMPLSWAIGDLLQREPIGILDTAPEPTPVNAARIEYLFTHNLHDLPDAERPICHRNGTSYTAVYGRMFWDKPAQTITTGFGTPGQGRYVHPIHPRVITPREAARIQGFPDWFDFAPPGLTPTRKYLAKWIGDAVHPMLGYAAGLVALSAISDSAAQKLSSAA